MFFFFKQKTAYEMRISDWSSDVCSSDLILAAIDAVTLDEGNDWFQPSNIEFTDVEVGNGATNVIPASARARLSIRVNDQHKGADLVAMIERIAHEVEPKATILGKIPGEAFLTPLGELSELVRSEKRRVG